MDEDMDVGVDVDTSDVDIGDDVDTADIPEDVPEDMPEDIPEDIPEDLDVDAADDIPEDADSFAEDIPEDVPDEEPAVESDELSSDIPEDAPVDDADSSDGDIPEDTSVNNADNPDDDIPEDIPEDTPVDGADNSDSDIPENVPAVDADDPGDDIPEDIPEDTPIDDVDNSDNDIPEDASADNADNPNNDVSAGMPEDTSVDDADNSDSDIPEDAPVDDTDDSGDDIPEDIPEDTSVDDADNSDSGIPENTSKDNEDNPADDISADVPEDTPADDAGNSDGDIPEDASADDADNPDDDVSVDVPENTPIDDADDLNDAASDADGTETDEQPVDTQDDSTAKAENDASDVDGAEADEQPADTQEDTTAETEDAASDLDGAEADAQPTDTEEAQGAEAEDAATNTDSTEVDKLPSDTYADTAYGERTPVEKLSDYMNQHNYGQGDYPEYSQDPEWQQLHRDAYPDQYDDTEPDQSDVTGQNFNPQKDTSDAFRYADAICDRSSPQWQEAANRHLDNLSQEMGEINEQLPTAKEDLESKSRALSDYINENGLTPESAASDSRYQELSKGYSDAQSTLSALENKQRLCALQINDIAPSINPDMRTSFRGMNGADFNSSYNDFITEPQGRAVPGFGGVCGIDETCSIVNQQTGSDLGEADGIKEYTDRGLCATGGSYDSNGGTNAYGRSEFLDSKGLTFDRVEGAYDTGADLSLDDIAQRFNAGESAGMMVKAEDLSQPELASRKFDLSRSFADNKGRFNANHATTVAGFSYGADGKVAGVWLNDTGGWAGSNRVYVDAAKFHQMQGQTRGFAVEFSRKR